MTFWYSASLNGYANLAVTINSQTITLPSVTDNNLSLKHYSASEYSTHSTFMTLVPLFTYVVLALLAFTFLFLSKVIAVDTLLVVQFAYGGLLTMQKIEVGMHPYKELSLFNGYNAFAEDGTKVPPRVEGLGLSADFFSNFNYGLILYLLPAVVGGTLMLIHFILKKLKKRNSSL